VHEPNRDAVGGVQGIELIRVRVADPDVVFFRSVIEAYDGLVQWTGDGSGVLTLTVPATQRGALDQLLADLEPEVALQVLPD
jgi:hypothetical protein